MINIKSIRPYLLIGILFVSSVGNAVGFRLPNQDPEGIARGNAFVATADNPSAIYHNPAGISQLEEGNHLSVGTYLISVNVDFDSTTGGPDGQTDNSIQAVPQLHYVHSLADSKFSVGVGLYAPYGLGIEWEGGPFPTLAEEGQLTYVSFNPVFAYQVSPNLSLAGGITVNFSEVDLTQEILPDEEFNVSGDGTDIGFNLGLLWNISSQVTFGTSYRSRTEIDYDGESQAMSILAATQDFVDTSASLVFPEYIDVGVAFRPNDKWLFEVNVDWTNWDEVNETTFLGTALGDLVLPLNYESSFMYEFGLTKTLNNRLLLSAGYIFSENSAPDESFTPFNPDANFQLGSIGISSREGKIGWSFGYHFAYNGGRDVSGNQTQSLIGETADGDFRTLNHAVNLALRFSF